MNVLLERGLTFLFALLLISQVIVPIFIPSLNLFWIFRKSTSKSVKVTDEVTVEQLRQQALEHSKALKATVNTVDDSIHNLEDIKRGI